MMMMIVVVVLKVLYDFGCIHLYSSGFTYIQRLLPCLLLHLRRRADKTDCTAIKTSARNSTAFTVIFLRNRKNREGRKNTPGWNVMDGEHEVKKVEGL